MRINIKFVLLIIVTVLLLSFRFFAQGENYETSLVGENHFHYNNFAMFIGASSLFERDATYFTLGADYIRYFSPESNFAAGLYAEAILADNTEWVLGALLYYGITNHLWLRTGPGVEILQEEIEHTGETESITETLYRVGAVYSVHFGKFFIDPSIDIDFLRSSTTLVWGVNIGMGF